MAPRKCCVPTCTVTEGAGVHVRPQRQMRMELDEQPPSTQVYVPQTQPQVYVPQTQPQVSAIPVEPVLGVQSSTSHIKQMSRQRQALKPISKTERELRDTLAKTKIKLRKCQNAKETFKTKLIMAKKIMKTSAFQILRKMTPAARVFFEMQIRQFTKKPSGRRFTLEQKILALSVYKPSPKSYKLLSNICILPRRKTLDKMLQRVQLLPGINDVLFDHLKKRVDKMPSHHKFCTLIFDEMAICPHVALDKKNDVIHGFVDNGTVRKKQFCDHVLVFMVRGVIKKFKQPVAFSFCTGSTETVDLSKQIEEIIKKVMTTGLNVIATVCDQGTSNLAALNILMNRTKATYLRKNEVYRDGFFEVNDKKIYPIYDSPHIMKGIRNNLLTKDMEYEMDGRKRRAKWAHLDALYRRGPGYKGLRLVNKLTAQHVIPSLIPKMRVKYCTQVFSENVGVAMGYLAESYMPGQQLSTQGISDKTIHQSHKRTCLLRSGIGKLPKESADTADLLLFFDKLFDSVNGSFSQPVRGKIYRCAVKPRSPHHKLWYRSLPILKSMKFVSRAG